MKKSVLFLGLVLIALGTLPGAESPGSSSGTARDRDSRVFSSSFDDGTLQGWGVRDYSDVSDEQSYSRWYSLKLNDILSYGDLAECYRVFSPVSRGKVDFWAYLPSGTPSGVGIGLTDQSSWQKYPNHRFYVHFFPDGYAKFCRNGQYYHFPVRARFQFDAWIRITLDWDSTLNQVRLSINGRDCGIGYQRNGGGAVRQVVFQSGGQSAVGDYAYFDNVRLTRVSSKTVFSSSFDDGTLQGWGVRDYSDVSDEQSYSRWYSLKLNDILSYGDLAECYRVFSPVSRGKVDFWAYLPSGTPSGVGIGLTDQSSWQKYPNHRFYVHFFPDGYAKFCRNGQYYHFPVRARFQFDAWIRITLDWDSTLNQVRLSINGRDCGIGYQRNGGGAVRQVVFQSGGQSAVGDYAYFDNIKLISQ